MFASYLNISFQTLREMYHDLETKHNSYCPNESEFRAYMVLMKLNEGDILRYIQYIHTVVECGHSCVLDTGFLPLLEMKPGSHVTYSRIHVFSPIFGPITNGLNVFIWCCSHMTILLSVNTLICHHATHFAYRAEFRYV